MRLEARAFAPPVLTEAAVNAVKALARGDAAADQQQKFLEFLMSDLCRVKDLSFRPDDAGGQRETDFAEGRRFVGLMLARMLTTPTKDLLPAKQQRKPKPNERTGQPG